MNSILAIGSTFLLIMIVISYYNKVNNVVKINKIFIVATIGSVFMCATVIALQALEYFNADLSLIIFFIKIRFACQILCVFFFFLYAVSICHNVKYDNIGDLIKISSTTVIISFIFLVAIIVTFFIPAGNINDYSIYVNGPIADYSVFPSCIGLLLIMLEAIVYRKNINKTVKVILSIAEISLFLGTIIQKYVINVEIVCLVTTMLVFLYYFYFENPDLQILKELEENTKAIDNANKARMNLLQNLYPKTISSLENIKQYSSGASATNPNINSLIDSIKFESNALYKELENILTVSKIEAGGEKLDINTYNVEELVNKLNTYAVKKLKITAIRFELNYDRNMPLFVEGDATRIYNMICNIINYSIKNTEVGKIILSVYGVRKDGYYTFVYKIADTGNGLSTENLNNLKLNMKNHNYNDDPEYCLLNYYLGLMGGTVKIDSDEGVGTTTTITFNQIITNDIPCGEMKLDIKDENTYVDCGNKKVAIVDNSKLNYNILSKLFKLYNVECTHVNSGLELANSIKIETKYDMIIFNKTVKDINIKDIMKVLKTIDYYKLPPIIAMDTKGIIESTKTYDKLGFDDIITMPLDKFEFDALVSKYLINR